MPSKREMQHLFEKLARTIIHHQTTHRKEELDPFEEYRFRIRQRLFLKEEETISRFMKGYCYLKPNGPNSL